jgi:hypothetical protein
MLIRLMLPLFLFFCLVELGSGNFGKEQIPSQARSGTLQKMIAVSGSATMEIDLNRLNGISSTTQKIEILRLR